jgi:hypothetical protein
MTSKKCDGSRKIIPCSKSLKGITDKMNLRTLVALQIRKHPRLVELIMKVAHKVSPENVAVFDYPINPKQRWDEENPHQDLFNIINQNREVYKSSLMAFLKLSMYFTTIPERQADNCVSNEPCWINGWMPALDGVALYSFIVTHKPKIYMEVGSGNSTKFARKAIIDHKLDTKIVSIDPYPRAAINNICDEIIRKPVEEINIEIFRRLDTNDILYIDNSHRVFMNSDATTIFLEVIPILRPGVLVEIHDVTLPYDYPTDWISRYYSEQYLLAAYLLAKGNMFEIILPNTFISHDNELGSILAPLWGKKEMRNVETNGCSFWIRMK